MAAIIVYAYDIYNYTFTELVDPRVSDLPFMHSPIPMSLLVAAYNYFILSLGPKLMSTRKPMDLKNTMIAYNVVQILFNAGILIEVFRILWIPKRYNFLCTEVPSLDDPYGKAESFLAYLYTQMKVLDLLDTVFMVLRKKQKQVSFLHVYHHSGMVVISWVCTRFFPGGYPIFFATLNVFVHTVMYSYYLITALYPQYKQNIWWKKHITLLQMVQFDVTFLHGTIVFFNPDCSFPKWAIAIFLAQLAFMHLMFWDFYKSAYLKPRKSNVLQGNETETSELPKEQIDSKKHL